MNDAENLQHIRHSCAHLLAAAIMDLLPNTKLTIGPAIENGFYYDFEFDKEEVQKVFASKKAPKEVSEKLETLNEHAFSRIEQKMNELLKNWTEFTHREVSEKDAREYYKNNPYKLELIDGIVKNGEKITFYQAGEFEDLCRGGHSENPKKDIGAFKLLSVAGAYWRGDEKNKMLTRIYGTAFPNKKELEEYLQKLEEAKKRDHRKLGKELDLFVFSDLVGSGLPLYTPKGTILIEEIKNALREISKKYDMKLVSIPHLAKIDLYKISGHAEKFADELFHVKSHYDQEFILKPVNCPHHTQIYASRPRSYRELPIRYIEQTMQYRDEKPGQIGGLQRTRGFTVDDGHTFCRVDQIQQEVSVLVEIIMDFYKGLGLWGEHWVSLSVRDPKTPEKYIGFPEDWTKAESMLEEVSKEYKLDAKRMEGEAAIYGPKLDFMFKDALGRETQLATIQLDFAMPKRFELAYIDETGAKKTPVMIHRAILGSFERFIMLLIEHYAGAFPLWLAPVQVTLLPIADRHADYAEKVAEQLRNVGIRAEADIRSERLQAKIRDATLQKVPFMGIIGDKEIAGSALSVRKRNGEDLGSVEITSFIEQLTNDIDKKR